MTAVLMPMAQARSQHDLGAVSDGPERWTRTFVFSCAEKTSGTGS
jgi:hypothetical protein